MPRVTTLMNIEDFLSLAKQEFKIVFVAVDGDPDVAMKTIGSLYLASGSTVAVAYSPSTNDDLLINCIRAGVQFLVYPFAPNVVEDAINRVNGRGLLTPDTKKAAGKSFLFIGAKGGAGGTTRRLAILPSRWPGIQENSLIDLDVPLGDAALILGLAGEFSTVDALRDPDRLDAFCGDY